MAVRTCSTWFWRAPYLDADAEHAFLRGCPPDVRRAHGVYFTPPQVVGAQVRLVDGVLRERLGCPTGLGDERVLIVDPACGTGAYPLAILARVGEVQARMRLFETLPEPASIARARGLSITECDVLTAHLDRELAAPIVVCLGNPPYRRRAKSNSMALDDFSRGAAGVHLKNLHNEYVAFWRWALRVAFEARRGAAIVCFVTASSYLRGPAFEGMRSVLRRVLDELWLIDLEGDQRAARATSNVFPIRTPVVVALGARYGATSSTRPAVVRYTRVDGAATAKRSTLEGVTWLNDLDWREARDGWGDSFVPVRRSSSDYWRWPALAELFPWHLSGAQIKRTWPIGATPDVVRARWRRLLALPLDQRRIAFGPTRDRDIDASPPDVLDPAHRLPALATLPADAPCPEPVRYAYRPFDRHWVVPDARLGDFPRPSLWRVAGSHQVFVSTMLTNVLGPGPAVVATRHVPDLDHFRGSFGARGVIPLWLDAEGTRPNVSEGWLERLAERYGLRVGAPELLAYCYALLSAPAYTCRFADELRSPGPRVPLAADRATFERVTGLGQRLLGLHTYQEVVRGQAHVARPIGESYPTAFVFDAASASVWLGDGCIAPVSPEVWDYSVSGYRVLSGWLRRRLKRSGRSPLDTIGPLRWEASLTAELLELVWLVEATIALGPVLDALLEAVVSSQPASRACNETETQDGCRHSSLRRVTRP